MSKMFIRFFTIADFEEEEIWLREQHKKGLKLEKMIIPCFYFFEECEPEDVVYRLDFKNSEADPEYTQMFSDYGWEYAGKCVGWIYFRKPASEMETETEEEIFSDSESKVSMLEKVIMRRMLPILIIFLCCCLPNLLRAVYDDRSVGNAVFFMVMTVLYVYIISHCSFKLLKLKKKYEKC